MGPHSVRYQEPSKRSSKSEFGSSGRTRTYNPPVNRSLLEMHPKPLKNHKLSPIPLLLKDFHSLDSCQLFQLFL